jgi:hypothetical protein
VYEADERYGRETLQSNQELADLREMGYDRNEEAGKLMKEICYG